MILLFITIDVSNSQQYNFPVHNFGFQPGVLDCDSSVHNCGLLLRWHWRLQKGFSRPTQSKVLFLFIKHGKILCKIWCKIWGKIWCKIKEFFSWLGFLGWCLTMSSLWLLPAYAIYKYNITEVCNEFETCPHIEKYIFDQMGWNLIFFPGDVWGEITLSLIHISEPTSPY